MNKLFIFVMGAAAGSLITWKLVDEKYKKLADEEIASVVEHFKNKIDEEKREKLVNELKAEMTIEEPEEEPNKEVEEYKEVVDDLGYSKEEKSDEDECIVVTEQAIDYIAPYTIAPEEFGEVVAYDTKSWTYYADDVLVDENEQIVSDPESIIGDGLTHFGEYEDDSVYVRNETTECDYEILKHEKTFSEINKEDN